ncbi:MAG: hypothetical protein NC390_03905 [Fusobacterium sp.]|nr:hypothetical protein [Fusobacterium sp.]
MPVPFGGMPVNFGRAIPSGSHCGTYRSFMSGGGNTNISIRNYNYGNSGCCGSNNIFGAPYMGGAYYGGGCCGGGGEISDKAALTALGVGAGIGLLASPLGGPILKGIGTGFKYTGRTLWEGGKALVNTFCYAGKGILNGIRKLFGKEPIENKWETFEMKNPFRSD